MFTDDTDLSKVPWQLLIRARTVREVDAVIASVVLNRIAEVGSIHAVQTIAQAAAQGTGANEEPATPSRSSARSRQSPSSTTSTAATALAGPTRTGACSTTSRIRSPRW